MSALKSSLLYQSGKVSSEPFVLTGPVIGMVTATSARVLVETNVACSVRITLKPTGKGKEITKTEHFEKRVPKCFNLEGLEPETYYKITLDIPTPGLVKAGFMTMAENWSLMEVPARIAFVAGNNLAVSRDTVDEGGNLWKTLFKLAHKGQIDYLVHLGNNVCLDQSGTDKKAKQKKTDDDGDNRWEEAIATLRKIPAAQWPDHYDDLCESFRGAYREAWNDPMIKHTLANVPNLMILNDKEICDNWGGADSHHDCYSAEFFVASCAYEVYNEYQRNLYSDYEKQDAPYASTSSVDQAYHFHVIGDIGIMMLDVRASRTLHQQSSRHPEKDEQLPLLGYRQWRDIEFALSDTGYFSNCRMLFIVSPTAPAVLGDGGIKAMRACGGGPASVAGQWYGEDHLPETSYLLSSLFDWRAKQPGHREICVVASGMGRGFMTDILDVRYGKLQDHRLDRLKQLVLAPISDSPHVPHDSIVKRALNATGVQSLTPNHQFKHYNNFDQLCFETTRAGKISICFPCSVWKGARQYCVVDVYLDYSESVPELGVVTKFTAQLTGASANSRTILKPVDNTFRARSNFQNSCLGMCDGANRPMQQRVGGSPQWGPAPRLSQDFELLSSSGGSRVPDARKADGPARRNDDDSSYTTSSGSYTTSDSASLSAQAIRRAVHNPRANESMISGTSYTSELQTGSQFSSYSSTLSSNGLNASKKRRNRLCGANSRGCNGQEHRNKTASVTSTIKGY